MVGTAVVYRQQYVRTAQQLKQKKVHEFGFSTNPFYGVFTNNEREGEKGFRFERV